MAEPTATTTGSTAPPAVLPTLLLYTLARLAIVAVLVAVIWVAGLPGTPAFLFGLVLAMPVSYLVLRPLRARLTAALVARAERKERIRAELAGSDTDDGRA
ncbi:DUF4229 domain-containing protein [Modestobacter marinus]|uniref:DUF4229 domain-containing protein n=1 Tax=Modestobacter marinus TaxID=477641 RepID=UPI001C954B78|nr:DUF4229 domain-containing protein [Modestobacter marinus]